MREVLREGGETLLSLFSEVPLNKFNQNEEACVSSSC